MALAMAGAIPTMATSPTPLTPSGLSSRSGSSTKSTSSGGSSACGLKHIQAMALEDGGIALAARGIAFECDISVSGLYHLPACPAQWGILVFLNERECLFQQRGSGRVDRRAGTGGEHRAAL